MIMQLAQALSPAIGHDQRSALSQPGVKPQEWAWARAKGLKARSNSRTGSIGTGFQPSDFLTLPNLGFHPIGAKIFAQAGVVLAGSFR